MNFPEKLKTLRKENNLTQEELAEQIFVSRTLISKYESGAVYPTEENIAKLASFFNIDKSELILLDSETESTTNKGKWKFNIWTIFNALIILICSLFILLTALPIFPKTVMSEYICTPGDPTPCYPIYRYEYHSGYELTLSSSNPILIFALISAIINIALSLLSIKKKDNKALRIANYVLFIINVFLFFFSIIFIFYYCRGANY